MPGTGQSDLVKNILSEGGSTVNMILPDINSRVNEIIVLREGGAAIGATALKEFEEYVTTMISITKGLIEGFDTVRRASGRLDSDTETMAREYGETLSTALNIMELQIRDIFIPETREYDKKSVNKDTSVPEEQVSANTTTEESKKTFTYITKPKEQWNALKGDMQIELSRMMDAGLLTVHKAIVNDKLFIDQIYGGSSYNRAKGLLDPIKRKGSRAFQWVEANAKVGEKYDDAILLNALRSGYMLQMLTNDVSRNDYQGKEFHWTKEERAFIDRLQRECPTIVLNDALRSDSGKADRSYRWLVNDKDGKLSEIFKRRYGQTLEYIAQAAKPRAKATATMNFNGQRVTFSNKSISWKQGVVGTLQDGGGYKIGIKVQDNPKSEIKTIIAELPYSLNPTQEQIIKEQQNSRVDLNGIGVVRVITAPTGSGKTFTMVQSLKALESGKRLHLIAETDNAKKALKTQLNHVRTVVSLSDYEKRETTIGSGDRQILDEIKAILLNSNDGQILDANQKLQISLLNPTGTEVSEKGANQNQQDQLADIDTSDPRLELLRRCAQSDRLKEFLPSEGIDQLIAQPSSKDYFPDATYGEFISSFWDKCFSNQELRDDYIKYSIDQDKADVALIMSPQEASAKYQATLSKLKQLISGPADIIEVMQFLQTNSSALKIQWDEYHESSPKNIGVIGLPIELANEISKAKFQLKGINEELSAAGVMDYFKGIPDNYSLASVKDTRYNEHKLPELREILDSQYDADLGKQRDLLALIKTGNKISADKAIATKVDVTVASATPYEGVGAALHDKIVKDVELSGQKMSREEWNTLLKQALQKDSNASQITINGISVFVKDVQAALEKPFYVKLDGIDVDIPVEQVYIPLAKTIYPENDGVANARLKVVNETMKRAYANPAQELMVSFLGIDAPLDDLSVGVLENVAVARNDVEAARNLANMIQGASDLRTNLAIFDSSGQLKSDVDCLKDLCSGEGKQQASKQILSDVKAHNEKWLDDQMSIILGQSLIPPSVIERIAPDRMQALKDKGWIQENEGQAGNYCYTSTYREERLGWYPDLAQCYNVSDDRITLLIDNAKVQLQRNATLAPRAADIKEYFENVRTNIVLAKILQETAAATGVSKEQFLHNVHNFDPNIRKQGSVLMRLCQTHNWDWAKIMPILGVNDYATIYDKNSGTNISDQLWRDVPNSGPAGEVKKSFTEIVRGISSSQSVYNPIEKITEALKAYDLVHVAGDAKGQDKEIKRLGLAPVVVTTAGALASDDFMQGGVAVVNQLHSASLHKDATVVGNFLSDRDHNLALLSQKETLDHFKNIIEWRSAPVTTADIECYSRSDKDLAKRWKEDLDVRKLSKERFLQSIWNRTTQQYGRALRVPGQRAAIYTSNAVNAPNILAEVMLGFLSINPNNSLVNPDAKSIEQSLLALHQTAGDYFSKKQEIDKRPQAVDLGHILLFLNSEGFNQVLHKQQSENPGKINYVEVLNFINRNVSLIKAINEQKNLDIKQVAEIIFDDGKRQKLEEGIPIIDLKDKTNLLVDIQNCAEQGKKYIPVNKIRIKSIENKFKLEDWQALAKVAAVGGRDALLEFVEICARDSSNNASATALIRSVLYGTGTGRIESDATCAARLIKLLKPDMLDITKGILKGIESLKKHRNQYYNYNLENDFYYQVAKLSDTARKNFSHCLNVALIHQHGVPEPTMDVKFNNLIATLSRPDVEDIFARGVPNGQVSGWAIYKDPEAVQKLDREMRYKGRTSFDMKVSRESDITNRTDNLSKLISTEFAKSMGSSPTLDRLDAFRRSTKQPGKERRNVNDLIITSRKDTTTAPGSIPHQKSGGKGPNAARVQSELPRVASKVQEVASARRQGGVAPHPNSREAWNGRTVPASASETRGGRRVNTTSRMKTWQQGMQGPASSRSGGKSGGMRY